MGDATTACAAIAAASNADVNMCMVEGASCVQSKKVRSGTEGKREGPLGRSGWPRRLLHPAAARFMCPRRMMQCSVQRPRTLAPRALTRPTRNRRGPCCTRQLPQPPQRPRLVSLAFQAGTGQIGSSPELGTGRPMLVGAWSLSMVITAAWPSPRAGGDRTHAIALALL
jgi:hypothetical protein